MQHSPNSIDDVNSSASSPLDIGQYLRMLRRNKWIIILSVIICLGVGYYVAKITEPVYSATAKILADPYQPNADREEQYIASAMVFLFFETQYEIIRSRAIAEAVVDKLNLVERSKQERLKNQPTYNVVKTTKNWVKTTLGLEVREPDPLSDEALREFLAAKIASGVIVSGGRKNQIITISYEANDPVEAAEIINALSDAYIEFGLTTRLNDVKQRQGWLATQYQQLQKNLELSEQRVKQFREKQGLIGSSEQREFASNQLYNLNISLVRAQTTLSQKREEQALVKQIKDGSQNFSALSQVMENLATNQLVKKVADAQNVVDELFERYGEKHPKIISARTELKSSTRSLEQEIAKVVEQIENDYKIAKTQVDNINSLIENTKGNVQDIQEESFALVSLEREVENNRRIYESFQSRLLEANVRGEINASNVHIIDNAVVPTYPISPNTRKIVALSGIVGCFLGLLFSLIREFAHNTFRTPDVVEDRLKTPVLGITPLVKDKTRTASPERQYLIDSRSPFSESINTIRTGLIFSNIDNPPQTILITSATGAEGKSTLAINLAVAFSNIGKTLLLEVDLRKPSLLKNIGLTKTSGLTDVLASTANFSDVVINENSGKLDIICCGTVPQNPMELLQSDKFAKLLTALKQKYQYIILDGPPTLPVSDSCIVGSKVDAVIVAVKAEQTRIKVAKEAVTRLNKLNSNIVGAVLTLAEPAKMSYYGDHYYVGEYYGSDNDKVSK